MAIVDVTFRAIPHLERAASLAERLADSLAEGVASGALTPGQRLADGDLALRLGVSRAPIREALKILEVQGIVQSSPHKGTRVATFDGAWRRQTREARAALEPLAFRDAALAFAADPARLAGLDRICARMEEAAPSLDWMQLSRLDLEFHRHVVEASDNGIVQTLWETLARHVRILFGHEIRDERDAEALGPQHRRLQACLTGAGGCDLEREVVDHIMRLQRTRP